MIVTFYSYKGGVGRSQLCANVAAYLCHKKSKRILLMDWDFEAPGLHYFYGKKNKDITEGGTIELLTSYVQMMRTTENVTEDNYPFFEKQHIIPMIPELETSDKGKIDLIPAGNYNDGYIFKVNTFDWYGFYELLDGKVYIEALKKWINEQDYDYSGICNIQLPDANVVVMAANNQNIEGCKHIIHQVVNSEYTKQGFRKSHIFPVLSRININLHR